MNASPSSSPGRPGALVFWSPIAIPGRPALLVVDGSGDQEGWEREFTDRVFSTMRRRGLSLKGDALARVQSPEELASHLQPEDAFNCILLFAHAATQAGSPGAPLRAYWSWLNAHPWQSGKLLAVCAWEQVDSETSRAILETPQTFAPLALAPLSPLTLREAGLYFLKFFAELDLHTSDSVTGKMVWFSASKAREILRRRKLAGNVGVRC